MDGITIICRSKFIHFLSAVSMRLMRALIRGNLHILYGCAIDKRESFYLQHIDFEYDQKRESFYGI